MSIIYKTYELSNGEIQTVLAGSEAEQDLIEGGAWSSPVPALNKSISDDGLTRNDVAIETWIPVWAEENGGISTGQYEWSYGNGATGQRNGITFPFDLELKHITLNAENFGTSVLMEIRRSRNGIISVVGTALFTQNNTTVDLPLPVDFNRNDVLIFRTLTTVGSTSDVRVCAWLKKK